MFSAPLSPPAARARLTVVAATYATEETRKKIEALAEQFEVVCVTCYSFTNYGLVNRLADQPVPTAYRLVGLPVVGRPTSTTRYFLRGLGLTLAAHPSDFILVESEPWAVIRWQTRLACWRHGRGAAFGEFSWENVRRRGWKGWLLGAVYRAAVRTADFVITGNAAAGELFRAAGLPADRLLISPQLGVDTEIFRPVDPAERRTRRVARGLPEDAFLIGFSGRLAEEKGLDDLVEAVARLRADGPGPNGREMHLAVLGHGPLAESLRARAAADVPPWLHVFPSCTHPEMAAFMQALDLFVLPSRELNRNGERWKEQFGHVLIEAMACGVPTLGSDSGAIPEVIGDSAMIFPSGDVARLTGMLRSLVGDPTRLAAAGAAGRARVLGHYTNAALAGAWARFLYGLPGRGGSGSPAAAR